MIRTATVRDARAIASVHVETWREAYAGILPAAYLEALSIEKRTESWELELDDPSSYIVVATEAGSVVGFLAGGMCRDADLADCSEIYAIYAIYVNPRAQHKGIGRRLVAEFFQCHHKPYVLWVLEQNLAARAFYGSVGFIADSATKPLRIQEAEIMELRYRLPPDKS